MAKQEKIKLSLEDKEAFINEDVQNHIPIIRQISFTTAIIAILFLFTAPLFPDHLINVLYYLTAVYWVVMIWSFAMTFWQGFARYYQLILIVMSALSWGVVCLVFYFITPALHEIYTKAGFNPNFVISELNFLVIFFSMIITVFAWTMLGLFETYTIILITLFNFTMLAILGMAQDIPKPYLTFSAVYYGFILSFLINGSAGLKRVKIEGFLNRKLLAEEKSKSESLLLNILPPKIAEELKEKTKTIAQHHNQVTVLFTDIANFTPLSKSLSPEQLIELLNNIFTKFDEIVKKYDIEKIKTIGDAYMAVAGVPEENQNHARIMANAALEMLAAADTFEDPNGNPVFLRIGMHSGPATAGVIGTHKFSYDLWGDAVNTAARMESHGEVGKIQVSLATYELLKDGYRFSERGLVDVKGKGKMQTFWLEG